MDKEEKRLIESMSEEEFIDYVIKSPKYGNIGFTKDGVTILPADWDEEEWSL